MSSSGSHIQHRTKSASLNPFKGLGKLNPFHRKSERSSKNTKKQKRIWVNRIQIENRWVIIINESYNDSSNISLLGIGGSEKLIPWGDDVNDESISLVENLIVSVSIDYRLHFDKQQQQKIKRKYPQYNKTI